VQISGSKSGSFFSSTVTADESTAPMGAWNIFAAAQKTF